MSVTLYAFDDARLTETVHYVVLLSDPSAPSPHRAMMTVLPNDLQIARYVVCADERPVDLESPCAAMDEAHRTAKTMLDKQYGEGQWSVRWIDLPRECEPLQKALTLLRAEFERHGTYNLADLIVSYARRNANDVAQFSGTRH
ncbi:hypothetical protein [Burkholderia pyrrocinia]|uniref:hypothetical protein n=1 Tax=Burkholderia pyrrocinia TaxID=60550 RepID=UPI001BCD1A24|nr:hypothetical protein [Burkholderia pyrrocinia]QVN18951.1 hypothetical protein JYG32_04225 [Burkholderia pyrrocinia]